MKITESSHSVWQVIHYQMSVWGKSQDYLKFEINEKSAASDKNIKR